MGRPARPILLFVFANPRRDLGLNKETSGIRAALRSRPEFDVQVLDHPSLAEIEDFFQQRRNQIVLFHFSGHANGFQQMLESETGGEQRIDTRGFAEFLASQNGLRFAFLNGCSTEGQTDELFAAGLPAVLATRIDVDDQQATQFSIRFYSGLASGADLKTAYDESVGSAKAQTPNLFANADNASRGIRIGGPKPAAAEKFPWQIFAQDNAALSWTLEHELVARRTQRGRPEAVAQGQLQQLLNFVKQQWIDRVLEQSRKSGLVDLAITHRPDLVRDPLQSIVEKSSLIQNQGDAGPSVYEIFKANNHRLLLLGRPGAGKTTCLLQLCADLVHHAQCDPTLPVPVVFSLSRWTDAAQSLHDWMQTQLVELYSAPRKVAGPWLDSHELILLLDGLDEVSDELRPGCVKAINSFLENTGTPGIIVSSRLDEYTSLSERLSVNAAVQLEPLTEHQIFEHVQSSGDKLGELNQLLARNEHLLRLAQTPLLLNIMSQVYDQSSIVAETSNLSNEQIVQGLFRGFVDRMFERRGRSEATFPKAETHRRLSWLAQRMHNEGSSVFLIELLQPSWLITKVQRFLYVAIVSLITASVMGVSAVAYWWGVSQISEDTALATEKGLYWWLIPLIFLFLNLAGAVDNYLPNFAARGDFSRWKSILQGIAKCAIYLSIWLALLAVPALAAQSQWKHIWIQLTLTGVLGSLLLSIVGWNHRTMLDIKPVERLRISWRAALRSFPLGFAAGFFMWLVFWLVWTEEPNIQFAMFPDWELGSGFGFMLFAMLVVGTSCGALLGSFERSSIKLRTLPNQGMINSRRNALFAGAITATALTLTISMICLMQKLEGTSRTPLSLLSFSITAGLLVFVSVGMISGGFDYLKHRALREILVASGSLPRRLQPFLKYCCELDFLQQVGGGFLFVHRLLLEHFSTSKVEEEPDGKPN